MVLEEGVLEGYRRRMGYRGMKRVKRGSDIGGGGVQKEEWYRKRSDIGGGGV